MKGNNKNFITEQGDKWYYESKKDITFQNNNFSKKLLELISMQYEK